MPRVRPLRPEEPAQLGGYKLLGCLGEGGQGSVYLAEGADGEQVALKILHARLSGDASARERFMREAEATRRVAPFSTARVITVGLEGDRPYIVSELVRGDSLQQVVTGSGPLREDALVRLAIGTVAALAGIHRAGIVHRDFKPSNVLLGSDGPRVVDFGIARALDGTSTLSSGVLGTPAYMSPEQISGDRLSPATDVFSWAVTMVFAATGRPAFGDGTYPVVMHRILRVDPDLSAVPASLRGLLARCLSKDPAQRPSATDLMLALVSDHGADAPALPFMDAGPPPPGQAPPTAPGPSTWPPPVAPPPAWQAQPGGHTPVPPPWGGPPAGRTGPSSPWGGPPSPAGSFQNHPTHWSGAPGPAGPATPWGAPPGPTVPVQAGGARRGRTAMVVAAAVVPILVAAVIVVAVIRPFSTTSGPGVSPPPLAVTGSGAPPTGQPASSPPATPSPATATADPTGIPAGVAKLWDARGGSAWINALTVGEANGEQIVVSGDDDGVIKRWRLADGLAFGQPIDAHRDGINSLAYGTSGGRPVVVSVSNDKTVRRWDLITGKAVGKAIHADSEVYAVDVVEVGGRTVIAAELGTGTALYDLGTGERLPLQGVSLSINAVYRNVGGRAVAVGGNYEKPPGVIAYDLGTGEQIGQAFKGHESSIQALDLGTVGDRQVILSGAEDRTIRRWDLSTGEQIGEPLRGHTDHMRQVALADLNGRPVILSTSLDDTLRMWDFASDRGPERTVPLESASIALALSRVGGELVALCGDLDGNITAWKIT
ncbi:hypothetical protein GCM10010156_05700 [Planobispora rosea]|uniref:Protein kinase domain-containing protein n=1 Tax=Planobispora rosea TaxID=35762 RepID=A0A8J3WBE9_PLARO|nr:serine/threonine-protein kinase [Planobispora rosea]GGS49861.1 hypothetical protein GCM10010156_05700 [Planobispora rosea]GIH83854.1 hypothetical protein Pro02_22620 [Planobispora rosea]